MILESVNHGLLIWPTIEENGVTKTKKYDELSATEKIQADCDLKATNIILQCLPSYIYSLVNHHRVAKDLWERIQLLMQASCISSTTRTLCNESVHNAVERNRDYTKLVAHNPADSVSFTLSIFDNNPQFQQQFSPSLSPQYGSIHPTQHLSSTHPSTPLAISYPSTPYSNAYTSTIDSGLAVPVFKQGDDLIDAINKMMSFLSTVVTSRFLSTNNQLRNSSNPRQQATIHDRKGDVQMVQGDKFHLLMVVWKKANKCPKPKRKRDAIWFRDKVNLVEAQGNGKVLNEEELEFLADPRITKGPVTQMVITHNAAYQADDLDAYDSDYDDFSTAKAVLMANLSSYGSDVLSEVPHSENTHTDMLNQSVQEMSYSEQTHLVNYPENEITSDSNIISYSQYLLETQNAAVQDTNYFAQQDAMI
ncbi:hypothetical protein Tco_1090063 [Tanacetum coccineum]|uniref:Integrase, catalytic region, zinc finger, CCHC-type, peptidase aspartic, catalytic n=1 Tax=Tanacetum coccineum TaxID=301880 RepID=A0ABQ5I4J5_9ASTR